MALTKISGGILDPGISVAGIVTATGFDGPFIGGSDGINAGVGTFTGLDVNGNGDISGNLVVGGNLTANGDFTTLNTTLREVELLRVDANSSAIAGIITQRGSGDIFSAYDTSTEVFKIADGGDVTFFGATTDRNIIFDRSENTLQVKRNAILKIGQGSYSTDLYSDGTNTIFDHNTIGALFIKSNIFQVYGTGTSGGNTYDGTIFRCMNGRTELGYEVPNGGATTLDNLVTTPIGVTVGTGVTIERNGQASFAGIVTFTGNAVVGSLLTASGLDINGNIDVDGHTELDNLNVSGISTFLDHVNLPNNKQIKFGGNSDFKIEHNSNENYIDSNSGHIYIRANVNDDEGDDIIIQAMSGEDSIKAIHDGAVELYHNGTRMFRTTAEGAIVSNIPNNYGLDINGVGNNTAIRFNSTGSSPSHSYRINFHSPTGTLFNSPCLSFDKTSTNGNFSGHIAAISDDGFHLDDNKKLHLGGSTSTGDLQLYHSSTNAASYIQNSTGNLFIEAPNSSAVKLRKKGTTETMIVATAGGAVELYWNNEKKLQTNSDGVEVTGEVAASQDYPNFRPVLDFNFAATKKLKPEMTFARVGEASFHDGVGSVKFVSDNEPRFEHDIVTGECKGLMFEGAGTNYSWFSRRFDVTATGSWVKVGGSSITADTYTAPDGTSSGIYMADTLTGANGTAFDGNVLRQQVTAGVGAKHTFSIYIKLITSTQATIYVRDGQTGSTATANAIPNTRNWQRVVVTSTNSLTNGVTHSFYVGNTNGTIAVWGSQIEISDYVTSYIKTEGGANGTRNTDKGVHLDGEDITDVFNQGEGTLIAEAILTQSLSNNPIVGFYEDFGSNNRLELRGDASSVGVARFEAVVGGSSVTSLTTSLGHSGVNNVSKYAYAFQENNYAGCVNGGSVTTDTSSTFPHGTGIDSMMIGEAVYNVDAAVIVKRIMYYADRLSNSQLVTLTS